MKQKMIIIMIILSLCAVPTGFANQTKQTNWVQVEIPSFPVTVNTMKINSANEKYPLIVYKSITYFPLTYQYAKVLGINLNWDAKEGLSIRKGEPTSQELIAEKGEYNWSNQKYQATLPAFSIFVNQIKVNNAKEVYPFLIFRDITYMPMTWQYTNKELMLETSFDRVTGFRVAQPKSQSTVVPSTPEAAKPEAAKPEAAEQQLYNGISPSLVKIDTYDSSDKRVGGGEGVIISKDGRIVTNYSVIKSSPNEVYAKVTLANGKSFKTSQIIDHNLTNNLVIIKIDSNDDLPVAKLANAGSAKLAQKVYAMNYPNANGMNFTSGIITNVARMVNRVPHIQTTAIGVAGGVLVNESGEILSFTKEPNTSGMDVYDTLPIELYLQFKFNKNALISDLVMYKK